MEIYSGTIKFMRGGENKSETERERKKSMSLMFLTKIDLSRDKTNKQTEISRACQHRGST